MPTVAPIPPGTVLDCGHPAPTLPPGHVGGDGVAHVPDGRGGYMSACYGCSDTWQADQMTREGETLAYVDGTARNVTTWSGGVLLRIDRSWWTAEGFGHGTKRTFRWEARDTNGARWYGRGPGPGMYTRARRAKARACST